MKFNRKWLWVVIPLIIFSLCWINSSSVSTVLLAIKGTITDGNLVKFSGTAGLGEDAGIATETTLTTNSDAKIPTSKAVNYFCETTKGYLTAESDPNALLTAGTDNVKDTHIDWGVEATQVSGADIPILESTHTVDDALDAGLRNGIYSGLVVTDVSGLNISWTAGVAYVDGSLFTVNSNASEDIADNDITYLYALKDNATLQESTTEPTTGVVGEFALVCILHTYATGVHEKFDFPYMSGELRYDLWKFLDDITPTATVGGCNTAIDTDVDLANDFTIATGTYYVDVFDLNTISSILYSSTATHDGNGLTAFYHVAGEWSSGAENGVNFSQWDNGTAKASTVANKWYVAWIYVEDGDTIYYVYPQTQHANEGSALAETPTYPPYHQGIILPSAKFIFRHGVSAFGATSYLMDIRPFFGYSDGGPLAQMIYQTVTGDSGSTTATASDDSVAIVGGGIATTAVTADTVTITATIPAEHIDSDMYTDASIDHEHLAPDVISGMVDVTADDLDYMLVWDNTDSALKKVDMAEVLGAGAGEANTASNVGAEVEIFKQKVGVDLEFRTLKAESNQIIVSTTPYEFDMGEAAIDRGIDFGTNTYISKGNPSTDTGIIGTIEIWANVTLQDCEVATFYVISGDTLSTRDTEAIGTVTSGAKREFSVSLNVEAGDYIGVYYSAGGIERDSTGGADIWYKTGKNIPCESVTFDTYSDDSISLHGISSTSPLDYIKIDVVEENIKLDDLGTPDDNTDNDTSTARHGLMPKLPFSGDLLSTTTVAFNADADTTLYTVPTGKRCILSHAIVVAAGDAGATTTVSIGQNTAETDFVPANILSNLDAEYDAVILMPVPNTTPLRIKSYVADTVIEVQVASQSGVAENTIYLFGILY